MEERRTRHSFKTLLFSNMIEKKRSLKCCIKAMDAGIPVQWITAFLVKKSFVSTIARDEDKARKYIKAIF